MARCLEGEACCSLGIGSTIHMPPALGKAALFAASILVVVAVFEAAIRVLDLRVLTSRYWTFDENLGWTQMPSRNFSYRVLDGDLVTVDVNSRGFRDREHALEKPRDVKEIVPAYISLFAVRAS